MVPEEHLEAEVLAALFGSEASFRAGFTTLQPESNAIHQFWLTQEDRLVSIARGLSLDSLMAIRNRIWFPVQGTVSLENLWKIVVQQLIPSQHRSICLSNSAWEPLNSNEPVALRRRWRWLTWALPPDFFWSALHQEDLYALGLLTPINPLLHQDLMDKGFAELHLHLGAGMDFSLYWCSAQHAVADEDFTEKALQDFNAPFEHGQNFAPWLLAGIIGRYLLCSFLAPRHIRWRGSLDRFIYETHQNIYHKHRQWHLSDCLLSLLNDLTSPKMSKPRVIFKTMQELYRFFLYQHLFVRPPASASTLTEIWLSDPAVWLMGLERTPEMGELYFLRCSFKYMHRFPKDKLFQSIFWQVVRIKNILYRYITQRPLTAGLQWFIRFFGRIKPLRKPLQNLLVECAFKTSGGQLNPSGGAIRGLRSLEIRTAPKNDISELKQMLVSYIDSWIRIGSNAEFCLVLHIPKVRGIKFPDTDTGKNSWANPEHKKNRGGYRFSHYYRNKGEEVRTMIQLLEQTPQTLQFLRGVDMCTDELGVPNWVMIPLIQQVCQASERIAANFESSLYSPKICGLRRTMHVGEDFRHLLEGLRRIYEALAFIPLISGDRLGHAVALGLSPTWWGKKCPIVNMPREERLFDLIWERFCYRKNLAYPPAGRLEKIEAEMGHLSQFLFSRPAKPDELEKFWLALNHPKYLIDSCHFPNGPIPKVGTSDNPLKLVIPYLTSAKSFEQGQISVKIVINESEILALDALQGMLRRMIAKRGLVVEVNPSSNFLIGDLLELSNHPIWRLNAPPGYAKQIGEPELPQISVVVGSDDPLIFAANLCQEYELLYENLLQIGIGDQVARDWLERVRTAGLSARFSQPELNLSDWFDLRQALLPNVPLKSL